MKKTLLILPEFLSFFSFGQLSGTKTIPTNPSGKALFPAGTERIVIHSREGNNVIFGHYSLFSRKSTDLFI